jgi:glutathionylspermidine amidase/synthetase
MQLIVHHLLTLALFVALGSSCSYGANKEIPESCRVGCITPYGKVLGSSASGVEAYSNCQSKCKNYAPNTLKGVYTGIKWQCVEYARRWLLVNKGAVYSEVDVAADIWDKIDHLTHVATIKKLPLKSYLNGSKQSPQAGDLLIYAREFYDTGHVAVITNVNHEKGFIEVGEQNYSNEPWPEDYARTIQLIKKGENYWLLDGYLLGWKHIQN